MQMRDRVSSRRRVATAGIFVFAYGCLMAGCGAAFRREPPHQPAASSSERAQSPFRDYRSSPAASGEEVPVWLFTVPIQDDGRVGDIEEIVSNRSNVLAPCASPDAVRAAHDAELPPRRTVVTTTESVTRNAVLTTSGANGRPICDRLIPVTVDQSLEAPPSPDGKQGFAWVTIRPDHFFIPGAIPQDEGAASLRITGWHGVTPRVFRIANLKRH